MKDRVIIIGAGLAGIVAAFAAHRKGVEVLVLDRTGSGLGTNSAMANAMFNGPRPDYTPQEYMTDTIKTGKNLNVPWMVEFAATHAEDAFEFVRPFGLDLKQLPTIRAFRGERQDIILGAQMMRVLAKSLARQANVRIEPGFQVTEILQQKGRAVGVSGWDRNGREIRFGAGAVILATGGAGALYLRNDNQKSTLGQGYILAAKAGLALWDLEFVQFYPLVLVGDRLPKLMLYPRYPPECRVINNHGEDMAEKFGIGDLNQAIRDKRDEFAACLFAENQTGQVFMDFTGVPDSAWTRYPLAMLDKYNFDFRNKPVPITPGCHFFMGGVQIDRQGHTSLPGLFACGEVVWGMHGANRKGGNALTECVVFGRLAGSQAASHAQITDIPISSRQEMTASLPVSTDAPLAPYRELLQRLREIAWYRAGIKRSHTGLEKGRQELAAWEAELGNLKPQNLPAVRLYQDLRSGAILLKGIITASLGRKESRGAFLREEYSHADENNWLKNSRLTYDANSREFNLDFLPVA